jgi:outer membrane protein assembly factor BamB
MKHVDAPDGSIVAFRLVDTPGRLQLMPVWQSRNLISPAPPVISHEVVFALSAGNDSTGATLYAFDPATGEELFSSGKTLASSARAGLTVVNNRVYVSTFDGTVYCFGFPLER